MSYRLFYAERSAAMGVRVLLEELAQPYELI
ncbi:MAG TPA: glutathione S-transferase family protein, partial [Acidobacteria bacterium]|nr:glutathione S-transferase family protein [Acidobacteriota bacterium]